MSGKRSGLDRDLLIPLGVVVAMSVAATMSFRSIFNGWSFLFAAVLGAVGSGLLILVADRYRLLFGEALAISLASFVLVGIVATAGLPTPSAISGFFSGLTGAWTELLSAAPPSELSSEFRVVPFTIAWLGTLIGGEVLRGFTVWPAGAFGPVIATGGSILFALERRGVALAQGAILAAGAIALGVLQHQLTRDDDTELTAAPLSQARRLSGVGLAGVVLTVVVVVAPLLGPRLPLASSHERFDLRQFSDPPFEPLAAPSPLVQVKAYLKDHRADEIVFTIESEDTPNRWTTAVLTSFDGVVWLVADPNGLRDEEFRPVDDPLPPPPAAAFGPDGMTETVKATVTIAKLRDESFPTFWLPSPGWPVAINSANALDVRMNLGSGTIALPGGVNEGLTYEISASPMQELSDAQLRQVTFFTEDRSVELELLPPPVRNLHADVVEGVDFGWKNVERIRDFFRIEGFYDDGDSSPPGHSYDRITRFLSDAERVAGYEEQYAAAAGVLARVSQLPTRVVVGYVIPDARYSDGRAEVRAADTSAWIEVRTNEFGWVPVDVTPDRSQTPEELDNSTTFQDVAIPNPPPPPPEPPDRPEVADDEEEVEEGEEEEDEEDEDAASQGFSRVFLIGLVAALPFVLAALFFGFVVLWKLRRVRRRRRLGDPAQRVTQAWYELRDRFAEVGLSYRQDATPRETAEQFLRDWPDDDDDELERELAALVRDVDRAAYHRDYPSEGLALAAWEHHDAAVGLLHADRSTIERTKLRLNPKPVFHRDEQGVRR